LRCARLSDQKDKNHPGLIVVRGTSRKRLDKRHRSLPQHSWVGLSEYSTLFSNSRLQAILRRDRWDGCHGRGTTSDRQNGHGHGYGGALDGDEWFPAAQYRVGSGLLVYHRGRDGVSCGMQSRPSLRVAKTVGLPAPYVGRSPVSKVLTLESLDYDDAPQTRSSSRHDRTIAFSKDGPL
jgi:hypothetical protein